MKAIDNKILLPYIYKNSVVNVVNEVITSDAINLETE